MEYVMDRYSQSWSWKITGERAVNMVSHLMPHSWCGDGPDEAIVPDNTQNVRHIQWMVDRYPVEVISKSIWSRRASKPAPMRVDRAGRTAGLERARPGAQFRGKLLDFQRQGLDFLIKSSGNALLADEMGLGKTVQTLAYLSTERRALPALVVAPLVTLHNWQGEIEKFVKKKSRNGRILGDRSPSSVIIRSGRPGAIGAHDYYVINYELLGKRLPDLSRLGVRSLVCDEVQNLRSKSTKKYAAVRSLASLPTVERRIGLSGTPIYNRGSEIWPIVDILKPGLLGNYAEFCDYFCYVNDRGKAIVLESKRDTLRMELQKHVMLRRKKSDVLRELKGKVRYKEIIDSDTDYYLGELGRIWDKLEAERQAARTAQDRSLSLRRAVQSERQAAGAAKIPHAVNFVKNIMEIEESVVVFCHHKYIHRVLHDRLAEFSPVSIVGGQPDADRQDAIDSFQGGSSKLMIAGLRAGNVGINLSRARYVVFAELDWSPAIHRQAEDRLHRIGQRSTVFAYYLVGRGTLDDHVAGILVDKGYEIDSIMDGAADASENREKAELILAQIQDRLRDR